MRRQFTILKKKEERFKIISFLIKKYKQSNLLERIIIVSFDSKYQSQIETVGTEGNERRQK